MTVARHTQPSDLSSGLIAGQHTLKRHAISWSMEYHQRHTPCTPDSAARLAGRQNTQPETHARCSALCQTALYNLPPLGSSGPATRHTTPQHSTAQHAK
jgi:hypothetical protein